MDFVGFFDSGIGGLGITKAVHETWPNQSIVYFADTANMPYGDKSVEAISEASVAIVNELLDRNCQLIVVACNSASSAALPSIKQITDCPIIDIIDPTINFIDQHFENVRLGLIATAATINSQMYQTKIAALNKGIEVACLATPALAPAIEHEQTEMVEALLKEYLSHPILQNIDVLLLGCSHYSLVKPLIQKYLPVDVQLIDTVPIVANAVTRFLSDNNFHHPFSASEQHFICSKTNNHFNQCVQKWFPNAQLTTVEWLYA